MPDLPNNPRKDLPNLADLRLSYQQGTLRRAVLKPNPLEQFQGWFIQSLEAAPAHSEPYALSLATADLSGRPSVRTVLLRGVSEQGLDIYTNYQSHKGRDLAHNPQAELLFYWPYLERQVRVYGPVSPISAAESDQYFHQRPRDSQLAAHASTPQSGPIASRAELEAHFAELEAQFPAGSVIPRPDFWGGYRLRPQEWEFWQGREGRMHDRFRYQWQEAPGQWHIDRLMP